MLYIFGGLPGSGKSTLAAALARYVEACYIRIDTIEQALRAAGVTVDGPQGYMVGYGLAADNLRGGLDVVADSVNPLPITRAAWVDVAQQADASYTEIEIICSDRREHQQRVETRPCDVPGLRLPTWQEVVERDYEVWDSRAVLIDTAGQSPRQSIKTLLEALDL